MSQPITRRGFAAGLALVVFAHQASAQEPGAPQEPAPSPAVAARDDDSARALKRILHLRGGTTLRAVARLAGDSWEYKQKGGWQSLPAVAVERTVLDKDARGELRKRSKGVGKDDLATRADIASWALSAGLLEEGLGELDAILTADPDQAEARRGLAENAHRFQVPDVDPFADDVPAACDGLVRWAASRTAASREIALIELAKVRGRDALQAHLASELFQGSPRRRSFAALALRRLFPGEATRPLLTRAVLDASDDVRVEASRALRDVDEVSLIVPVTRTMERSTSQRVRLQATEALGNMGYRAAVAPLINRLSALQGAAGHGVPHSYIFIGRQFAYIQDFDVEVAQFQAVADPQINVLIEGQTTEAGVLGVKQVSYATERRSIMNSLGQLTGANPGRTSKAWMKWWDQNASAYVGDGAPETGGH